MIKADYSKIASFYDKGRSLSIQNRSLWLNLIIKKAGIQRGSKVLDLGCGTGRFSLPMAMLYNFNVIGADSSLEMIEKAKTKDSDCIVTWCQEDANKLSFSNNSFDAVFMSHLLHHVDNPQKVLKECYRVINSTGVVIIRYGSIEQIKNDVEHTFFPQVTEIDELRTPSQKIVEEWLFDTGFLNISSREIVQQTYKTGNAHLKATQSKSTSVLNMISEESFRTGISRLKEYVKKNSNDDWLLFDKMTLTVGFKSKRKD